MKNLQLLRLHHKNITDLTKAKILLITPSNHIYYIENEYFLMCLKESNLIDLITHFGDEFVLLGAHYVQFERKICVASESGHIYVNDDGNIGCEIISLENQIKAIQWNPMGDLVAIVTANQRVQVCSINYENCTIFQHADSSIYAKIPESINVGWGSSQTQFQGSNRKVEEVKVPNDFCSGPPQISWRGNGEMFVVNNWFGGSWQLTVFSAPSWNAFYRSDVNLDILAPIAWRPIGNMIMVAGSQNQVEIFEKNCLKRTPFRFDQGPIKEFKWSPCGQIVAISTDTKITLWTYSNCKWYQKQTLDFQSTNHLLLRYFQWSITIDNDTNPVVIQLQVFTTESLITYEFHSNLIRSKLTNKIAVINGDQLQITDFTNGIIPPPLSTFTYQLQVPINTVIFTNSDSTICIGTKNDVIIIGANQQFTINDLVVNLECFPLNCHHFSIGNENELVFFAELQITGTSIYVIDIINRTVVHKVDLKQTNNHNLNHLTYINNEFYINLNRLDQVHNFENGDSVEFTSLQANKYKLTLDKRNQLKLNDEVTISECCNNYVVIFNDQYLLLTTKSNQLYCIDLTVEYIEKILRHHQIPITKQRMIEQGGFLICVLENGDCIMQMPRGNLETINCQYISKKILDQLLEQRNWPKALEFLHSVRLPFKFLLELDCDRFYTNSDDIFKAMAPNELNNLVTDLYNNQYCNEDKVFGYISDYLLNRINFVPYISTMLMIRLRTNNNNTNLKQCMQLIQDLLRRTGNLYGLNVLKMNGCTDDQLFRSALSLYDLNLAETIAKDLQLDPRLYGPQLKNYANLSDLNLRYLINLDIQQPDLAIRYLLRLKDRESDLCQFLDRYQNHQIAYVSCPQDSPYLKLLSKLYGGKLMECGRHLEAGFVYEKASFYTEALNQYELLGMSNKVIELIKLLKLSNDEQLCRIEKLIRCKIGRKEYEEAANLYVKYVRNYSEAIKVLVQGRLLEQALHLAKEYQLLDLIDTTINPAIVQMYNDQLEKLHEIEMKITKYKNRLTIVYEQQHNSLIRNEVLDDGFSDISSITATSISNRSTLSSRNRRKNAKKMIDLREGGIFEDIALIRMIHLTIQDFIQNAKYVQQISGLVLHHSNDQQNYVKIRKLYELFQDVYKMIQDCVLEIWPLKSYRNLDVLNGEFRIMPVLKNEYCNQNVFPFSLIC